MTSEYLDCGFLHKGTLANYAIFTGLLGIVLQKTDIALPFTSNSFIHNSFEVRLTDSGYNKGKHRAKQSQMYLGNRDLEWFVTFTCNFCNGSMKQIGHMAKGLHAICGFSTSVILTSDMGKVMAGKLKKGISVKEAFFATAKETQPWKDFKKRTACVFTTRSCANDRIWGYGKVAADPKPYSSNPSIYVMYSYNF